VKRKSLFLIGVFLAFFVMFLGAPPGFLGDRNDTVVSLSGDSAFPAVFVFDPVTSKWCLVESDADEAAPSAEIVASHSGSGNMEWPDDAVRDCRFKPNKDSPAVVFSY